MTPWQDTQEENHAQARDTQTLKTQEKEKILTIGRRKDTEKHTNIKSKRPSKLCSISRIYRFFYM